MNVCEKEELPCFLYLIQIFGPSQSQINCQKQSPKVSNIPWWNQFKVTIFHQIFRRHQSSDSSFFKGWLGYSMVLIYITILCCESAENFAGTCNMDTVCKRSELGCTNWISEVLWGFRSFFAQKIIRTLVLN